LFNREFAPRVPPELQRIGLRKLQMLHAATSLQDLLVPPGNRLERLSGDRAGQHSIRLNDQWRLCFRWQAGDAFDVEIVDYHR
jgi:toxin HigB-1